VADLSLAPTYTHRFDNDGIKSGSFAKQGDFPRFVGNPAQAAAGRRRADKGIGMHGKLFHSRLITQYAALADAAGRVDRQYCYLFPLPDQVHAESLDESAFPDTGHTGNADPYRVAGIGQQSIDQPGRLLLMIWPARLDKRDRPAEQGDITLKQAFFILFYTECCRQMIWVEAMQI